MSVNVSGGSLINDRFASLPEDVEFKEREEFENEINKMLQKRVMKIEKEFEKINKFWATSYFL